MKTIVLILAIVALGTLSASTRSATPFPSFEDHAKRRDVMQGQVEIMEEAIKRESLKLKIGNLKDRASRSAKEIRIWVGFGIIVPRLFIMRELNGKREAVYINAKASGNRVNRRGEIRMVHRSLAPPKSGWNEFAEFIKSHGIESPMKLSLEERYEPDPDEEAIAIQIKSQGKYEIVFYLLSTKSEDGHKALEVCRRIEQEFGILMGCGKPR